MNRTKINKEIILDYIEKNNLTKKEFCEKCGISQAVLKSFLENKQYIRLSGAYRLIRFLGIKFSDLITIVTTEE